MAPVTAGDLLRKSGQHPDAYLGTVNGGQGWHLLGRPKPVGPFLVFSPGGISDWRPVAEKNPEAEIQVLDNGVLTTITQAVYVRSAGSGALPLLILEGP